MPKKTRTRNTAIPIKRYKSVFSAIPFLFIFKVEFISKPQNASELFLCNPEQQQDCNNKQNHHNNLFFAECFFVPKESHFFHSHFRAERVYKFSQRRKNHQKRKSLHKKNKTHEQELFEHAPATLMYLHVIMIYFLIN